MFKIVNIFHVVLTFNQKYMKTAELPLRNRQINLKMKFSSSLQ